MDTVGTDSQKSAWQQPAFVLIFTLLSLLALTIALASCQEDSQGEPSPSPVAGLKEQPTVTQGVEEPIEENDPSIGETPNGDMPASTVVATEQATTVPEIEETALASTPTPSEMSVDAPEGALLSVEMESRVGVLLDEIPEGVRDRVVESLRDRPESYWHELAQRQIRLTKRRLNFRNFVYADRGQLPLPPEELWSIQITSDEPQRESIDGHDLLMVHYTFTSTLLTDGGSPGAAEPELQEPGGKWTEPFILPADPDLLLQRTGNACLNEAGFPPGSFDSENAWVFYDYTCEADSGGVLGCHRSRLHQQSCLEALNGRVGTVETGVRFEYLDWDPDLADSVRIGELTHLDGPDLQVVGDDLEVNRVIYRYFPEDSCALVEQCVSGSGWRRLLQFNATVHNVGAETMYIGPVVAENPVHNLFQYNACHAHYHFSDYGDFTFAGKEENLSSKQAFCVESTNRFSNNEWSPLTHDYTCRFQGVQAGWVDEYVAGLDCQWIDITDVDVVDEGETFSLGLVSNPDGFLCEGDLVLDDEGNPVWEPSGQTTPAGAPINRPQCDFVPDWDVNNDDSRQVSLMPTGSFVTEPCSDGQFSPLRNCGFKSQLDGIETERPDERGRQASAPEEVETPEGAFPCRPGESVRLTCNVEDGNVPQVMRLCEYSTVLGTGVACTFGESLANATVTSEAARFEFICPIGRDENEPGGLFSLYTAPLFGDEDEPQPISCLSE